MQGSGARLYSNQILQCSERNGNAAQSSFPLVVFPTSYTIHKAAKNGSVVAYGGA